MPDAFAAPARTPRAFLALLLLLYAAGALAVCREYAWRWRDAESVARSFATAALAGDDAALARLGTADARTADLFQLPAEDARRCVGDLRFVEGRRRPEDTVLLLFAGPAARPLGYRPTMFLMHRTGNGWRVNDVGFYPVRRHGRVAAIDIPTM